MAGGREFSAHQRKIIDRYYQNKDSIMAHKLGEIVSDLAIAAGDDKKQERLWKRAEQALKQTDADPADVRKVLASRSVEALSRLVGKIAS